MCFFFFSTILFPFIYLPSNIHLKHFSVYSSANVLSFLLLLLVQHLLLHLNNVSPCIGHSNIFFFILEHSRPSQPNILSLRLVQSLLWSIGLNVFQFLLLSFLLKWGWQDLNLRHVGPDHGC